MRGKEITPFFHTSLPGITPAYAGKSGLRSKVERNDGDHPRLCGEKVLVFRTHSLRMGSPPPMRGKDSVSYTTAAQTRITPAYAGKRVTVFWRIQTRKDHPRLCGEKFRIHLFITCQPGSPPPMRGKVPQFYFSQIVYRITPAYAGKSSKKFDLSNCK